MTMLVDRLRNWIACYAAAITIILQQLNTQTFPEAVESPTPLVRIRASFEDGADWHPDELIANHAGTRSVVVWESRREATEEFSPVRILSN